MASRRQGPYPSYPAIYAKTTRNTRRYYQPPGAAGWSPDRPIAASGRPHTEHATASRLWSLIIEYIDILASSGAVFTGVARRSQVEPGCSGRITPDLAASRRQKPPRGLLSSGSAAPGLTGDPPVLVQTVVDMCSRTTSAGFCTRFLSICFDTRSMTFLLSLSRSNPRNPGGAIKTRR